jgi:hypothetical protein
MGGSTEKKLKLFLQIYLQIKKQVLHLYHCNGAAQVQNITKQKNVHLQTSIRQR